MQIDEEKLSKLLEELKNSVVMSQRKYFHLRTIENLIFHFHEIKTEIDRKWVYSSLEAYFNKCSEVAPYINREVSKNLYYEYIDKIADYYHTNLGFSILTNRMIVYLVYLIALILCYIFLNIYVVILMVVFFLHRIIDLYKRMKEKKVYSIFW